MKKFILIYWLGIAVGFLMSRGMAHGQPRHSRKSDAYVTLEHTRLADSLRDQSARGDSISIVRTPGGIEKHIRIDTSFGGEDVEIILEGDPDGPMTIGDYLVGHRHQSNGAPGKGSH